MYYLPTKENKVVRVCKSFFLSTLCISSQMIAYNRKRAENGVRSKAARPPAHNRICDVARQSVKDHINSFYRIESHYCRSSTQREYLEATLNKTRMFRLYQTSKYCHSGVKSHLYSTIFDTEFNLGFHRPSKDLCDLCDKFKKAQDLNLLTEDMVEEKKAHDA